MMATWNYDYATIRRHVDRTRRDMIARARLTADELATAAALYGIVADADALPYSPPREDDPEAAATDDTSEGWLP
jgi:hypothetical protein